MINKIKTYFNFAIKASKLVYGYDNIKIYCKKAYLIVVCKTANEKMVEKLKQISEILGCKLYQTVDLELNEFLNSENCKVCLFRNQSLAQAILKENEQDLREVK